MTGIFFLLLRIIKDGSRFKLISMYEDEKREKSPLEGIKGVKANVSMHDILDAIKDGRERQ